MQDLLVGGCDGVGTPIHFDPDPIDVGIDSNEDKLTRIGATCILSIQPVCDVFGGGRSEGTVWNQEIIVQQGSVTPPIISCNVGADIDTIEANQVAVESNRPAQEGFSSRVKVASLKGFPSPKSGSKNGKIGEIPGPSA